MNSLVSVIVPVYNCRKYIKRCVESVLSQSCVKLELILVVDGIKDDSISICKMYEKKYNNVIVYCKENEGVSVARNTGIDISKGDWIVFLDADDWLEQNSLSQLIEYAEQNRVDIGIGDYYLNIASSETLQSFFCFNKKHVFKCDEIEDLIKSCLVNTKITNRKSSTNVGVPWAKIYRKQFLVDNNLRFVPGLKRMQDAVFNLYAFSKANKVVYFHIPLYHYFKNSLSSTVGYKSDFLDTARVIISEIIKYQQNSKLTDFNQIIIAKTLMLYTEMIYLQFIPSSCKLTFLQKIKKLKELRNCEPFNILLNENCSMQYFSKKQTIDYWLIRKNIISPVYFYYLFKRIKMRI